jgi:hypothetical protein
MKINLMEQGPNPARSANTNLHTPSGNTRSITGMEARRGLEEDFISSSGIYAKYMQKTQIFLKSTFWKMKVPLKI